MSEKGIKETKEVITGAFALTGLFIKRFKDGFDPMDPVKIFIALQSDPIYKEAIKGIQQVPVEAADLSVDEIFELGAHVVSEGKNLVLGILQR